MNAFIELFIIIFLVAVLLIKPKILCNCGKNILGKIIFAILIFILANCNIVYGILGVLLYIVLNSDGNEEVIMISPHHMPNKIVKHDCIRGQPNHLLKKKKKKQRKVTNNYSLETQVNRGLELLVNEETMRACDSNNMANDSNVVTLGGEVL